MKTANEKYDVSIIIVTYNSADEIETCLNSVYDERKAITQEVIVIDNLSSDNTVAIIKEKFPQVRLIEPGENLGFAAGVNLGASLANSEFILLFNPDAEVRNHAIDTVVDFARKKPQHGLYGGRSIDLKGQLDPGSCWGAPSLWSLFLFATGLTTLMPRHPIFDPESIGEWQRDTEREVGIITGCFLLAKLDIWKELEGFDERYFMYGEDADLAIRARKLGYSPVICPDAEFIHEGGKSSDTPVEKTLLLYRGKASLVRIQWSGLKQKLGLLFLAWGTGLRALMGAFMKSRAELSHSKRWKRVWRERRTWLQGYPQAAK